MFLLLNDTKALNIYEYHEGSSPSLDESVRIIQQTKPQSELGYTRAQATGKIGRCLNEPVKLK